MKKLLFSVLVIFTSISGFCKCSFFDVNIGYKYAYFDRDVDTTLIATSEPGALTINYDHLSIINLEVNARLAFTPCFYFRCRGDYGWIVDGDVDRRTDIISLQPSLNVSFSSQGHVADLDGGFGYTFFPCRNLEIGPAIGWGYSEQAVTGLAPGTSGSFFSNKLYWIGPWLGVDIAYHPTSCLSLSLEYEFHWVHYKDTHVDLPFGAATLNFNYKDAIGNTLFVDGVYLLSNGWRVGIRASVESWQTRGNPDINAVALTPFPITIDAEQDCWFSAGIQGKIGYTF